MENEIEIELNEFILANKRWPGILITKTMLMHSFSGSREDKETYTLQLKQDFMSIFGRILLRKLAAYPSIKATLLIKLSRKEPNTLLDMVSHAVYKKYIEGQKKYIGGRKKFYTVAINKKQLNKLRSTPAKIIGYIKEIAPLFEGMIDIKTYTYNENIYIELILIFQPQE